MITVTADQADRLREHGRVEFVVEGGVASDPEHCTHWVHPAVPRCSPECDHRLIAVPPARYAEHDGECTAEGWCEDGYGSDGCPACHGTGRKVVRVVTECDHAWGVKCHGKHPVCDAEGQPITVTVRVLPVRHFLDPIDDADEVVVDPEGGVWFQTARIAFAAPPRPNVDYVVILERVP